MVLCAQHLRTSVAGETVLKEAELRTSLSIAPRPRLDFGGVSLLQAVMGPISRRAGPTRLWRNSTSTEELDPGERGDCGGENSPDQRKLRSESVRLNRFSKLAVWWSTFDVASEQQAFQLCTNAPGGGSMFETALLEHYCTCARTFGISAALNFHFPDLHIITHSNVDKCINADLGASEVY